MTSSKIEDLKEKHCKACEGGVSRFKPDEAKRYLSQLKGWSLSSDNRMIHQEYKFKNFKEVVVFFNQVAQIAEEENHHPFLKIGYNKVEIELSTHSVGGLSENDFILAAKIDAIK